MVVIVTVFSLMVVVVGDTAVIVTVFSLMVVVDTVFSLMVIGGGHCYSFPIDGGWWPLLLLLSH